MFGFFGGNKGSSKPTVKQIVTQLRLPSKGVMWKEAQKELKSVLPYITEEELMVVQDRFKESGRIQVRLSRKEADLFKTLVSPKAHSELVPREEYTCCGTGVICGDGCAMEVQSSKYMGPTDLGIVPVPVPGGGGDDEIDFATEVSATLKEGGTW